MFHVDNGAGRFSAIYEPAVPGSLCNGKWHRIIAHKMKHRLILTVDGHHAEGISPNAASSSAETNDPVFVGGYPGEYTTSSDCQIGFVFSMCFIPDGWPLQRAGQGESDLAPDLSSAFDTAFTMVSSWTASVEWEMGHYHSGSNPTFKAESRT